MKTLVFDLGNTTLYVGEFRNEKLARQFRVPVTAVGTAAAFAAEVAHRLPRDVNRVAMVSVVPTRTARLAGQVRKTLLLDPMILTPAADHGLKIAYRNPAELGADRLATALGARKLYPGKNILIVDCGTATTLTLLGHDGVVLGGSIMPGVGLWPAMLKQHTARLPEVTLQMPRQVVARDTVSALRSGILHGHAGALRELIAMSRAEAFGRAPAIVIGTGGWVTHFKGQRLFTALEPGLILHGLQAFASRNHSHA